MKEQLRFYIVVLVMIALIILGFYLPVAFLLTGRAIYIIPCIAAIILAIAQLKIRVINRESHKKNRPCFRCNRHFTYFNDCL